MMPEIVVLNNSLPEKEYEFVERKGSGHPDTLADELAERLSREYSNYTNNKFGAVLHHNFDKVGILGGASHVRFGVGYLTQPLRVLVNGRVSTKFGDELIPINELIESCVKRFFLDKFPEINTEKDITIHYNLSNKSSPGKTDELKAEKGTRKYWFEPRNLDDLRELRHLGANDTATGTGFAPLTALEQSILEIEQKLNSTAYKIDKPWLGSDIKITGTRIKNLIEITLCIPQISRYVANIQTYTQNLEHAKEDLQHLLKDRFPSRKPALFINTRDDLSTCELYLTAIGSSIESGDEGLVGRGNRANGLISMTRPYSMEGVSGKNPVYHAGKLYTIAAQRISQRIYSELRHPSEVFLVSQSGRHLMTPWKATIITPAQDEFVKSIAHAELNKFPEITRDLLGANVKLC